MQPRTLGNCLAVPKLSYNISNPVPLLSFLIDDSALAVTMAYQKIDHDFKNDALSYDAKPNYQPCIKLSFWFNKLPEVSHEAFHSHWETVHADLTIATKDFGLCKVQRYVYAPRSGTRVFLC